MNANASVVLFAMLACLASVQARATEECRATEAPREERDEIEKIAAKTFAPQPTDGKTFWFCEYNHDHPRAGMSSEQRNLPDGSRQWSYIDCDRQSDRNRIGWNCQSGEQRGFEIKVSNAGKVRKQIVYLEPEIDFALAKSVVARAIEHAHKATSDDVCPAEWGHATNPQSLQREFFDQGTAPIYVRSYDGRLNVVRLDSSLQFAPGAQAPGKFEYVCWQQLATL